MRRKKLTQSHTKDSNGVESDELEDDDENDEGVKALEREDAEQDVNNESEQMEVTNTENVPEVMHAHNEHVSSAEGDCTDSSVDGIQDGKSSSPGLLSGDNENNGEVQPMEQSSDKRMESDAKEDSGIGEACCSRKIINGEM